VPCRSFHANLINALAALSAIGRYANAKMRRRALTWLKTDHSYPDRGTLSSAYRNLEDALAASGLLEAAAFESTRRRVPDDAELDDYLVHTELLTEQDLGGVLSMKDGVPAILLDPEEVDLRVARVLPVYSEPGLHLIPFRVERGRLLVAGPVPPKPNFRDVLRRFTKLEVEFHLVTWRNFEELRSLLV
jgi:adsorption protein B